MHHSLGSNELQIPGGRLVKIIPVPRTPKSAMNKDRVLSYQGLLWHQIRHFREVEQKLPAAQQSGIDVEAIRTEGQAAEYIRHLTSQLHPQGAKQASGAGKKPASRKKRRSARGKSRNSGTARNGEYK